MKENQYKSKKECWEGRQKLIGSNNKALIQTEPLSVPFLHSIRSLLLAHPYTCVLQPWLQNSSLFKSPLSRNFLLLTCCVLVIMSSPKPLVSSVSVLSASNAANKLKPRSKPKPLAGDPPTSTTEKENQDPQSSEDSERGRPSACVFVASLCSTTADDDLCVSVTNLFEKWGKITRVKVLRDTRNRPYAFVQYTNDKDAAAASKG